MRSFDDNDNPHKESDAFFSGGWNEVDPNLFFVKEEQDLPSLSEELAPTRLPEVGLEEPQGNDSRSFMVPESVSSLSPHVFHHKPLEQQSTALAGPSSGLEARACTSNNFNFTKEKGPCLFRFQGSAVPTDQPSKAKYQDKASDEYRRRRDRNNIAVKKCRKKKMEQQRQTQNTVKTLEAENSELEKSIHRFETQADAYCSLFRRISTSSRQGVNAVQGFIPGLASACNDFRRCNTPSERLEKLLGELSVSNEPRDVQFVSQATDRGFGAPVNPNLSMFGVSATTPGQGNLDSSASEESEQIQSRYYQL
ncbi:CCAAT/enhancer-binding protein [Candidiatus Paracoxiella cheracis]|uniref:CCAAT/enhancer-binding protein n=1 Tax=Candidiatus Paracoxiella cheracis TaxID=3405120 RepID=UPI003BF52249